MRHIVNWRSIVVIMLVFTSFLAAPPGGAFTDTVHAAYYYRNGSSGEMVKFIQSKLTSHGYYQDEIDGRFGEKTRQALKQFQHDYGLDADGVAGPKTLEVLSMSEYAVPASVQLDDYETMVWLLACLINGEGRGESYEGQVAIGAVVINRLFDPAFPDSLVGVIFQPGQFSAVKDGQINLEPSESCLMAAREALAGKDPAEGSLYFWNPKTATCTWIKKLKVTTVIGNHAFGSV